MVLISLLAFLGSYAYLHGPIKWPITLNSQNSQKLQQYIKVVYWLMIRRQIHEQVTGCLDLLLRNWCLNYFFTVIKHTNITTSINEFYWMSKLLLSYLSYLAGLMTILFTWVTYVQNSLLFMENLIQRTTIPSVDTKQWKLSV